MTDDTYPDYDDPNLPEDFCGTVWKPTARLAWERGCDDNGPYHILKQRWETDFVNRSGGMALRDLRTPHQSEWRTVPSLLQPEQPK